MSNDADSCTFRNDAENRENLIKIRPNHCDLGQGLSTPRSRNCLRITERFKQIGRSAPLSTRRLCHHQSSPWAPHGLTGLPRPPPWPAATPSPLLLDRQRDRPDPPRSAYVITWDREKENKKKRLGYFSSLAFDVKTSVQIISITSPSTAKALSSHVANHSK